MSKFEYIAVLVSLILGLGITNILRGLGHTINQRNEFKIDSVHLMWSLALFVVLVLNWWVFFKNSEISNWTFEYFLSIIVWAVSFYLMTVVLFPLDHKSTQDYGAIFEKNRSWFLGLFIIANLMDILVTALRGQLFNPAFYLPFVTHFVVLGVLGIYIKSRIYHLGMAAYIFTISLTWSFVVRLLLG